MRTYWYIAKTKHGRERYAKRNVDRQTNVVLKTWLPVIEGRRGKEEILFPSYLFVQTHGQWRFLTGTYGISSVLMVGDEPGVLHHSVIRSLRARVGELNKLNRPVYRYAKDQKVRMIKGQFAGIEGLYHSTSPEKRICILLSLLGRKVLVEQDAEFVVAA